ncbi:MAG: FHA domain-containing protein [Dehalococcoidia bacterium]
MTVTNEGSLGYLVVEGPDGQRREQPLAGEMATIGRSEDNEVILPDPAVSRHHAQFTEGGGQAVVLDLGSLNGTIVNGVRLAARQPFQLRSGDRIAIGPFTLTYDSPASVTDEVPLVGQTRPAARPTRPVIPPEEAGEPDKGDPATDDRLDEADLPNQFDEGFDNQPVPAPVQDDEDSGFHTIVAAPTAPARLMVWVNGESSVYPLGVGVTTIGRSLDNSIVVPDPTVSRQHAEIHSTPAGWELLDLGSGNGIYHHGHRIERKLLSDNDAFRIGEAVQIVFLDSLVGAAVSPPPDAPQIDLTGRDSLTIGRDRKNDLTLGHPQVSRFHARIERRDDDLVLVDLGATNGTFLNGKTITQAPLAEGDHLQIGPYSLTLVGGKLAPVSTEGNIRVDAIALTRTVGRGITILDRAYLTIKPREFVAVVGASGSGKSTLVDALCGFRPATSGTVLYNGLDLYQTFDAFRASIGYVPQDDIIHRDLPLRRALGYAAELRLPRDTTAEEREARIDEVLDEFGLRDREHTPINRLSGGQRKRVSIGVELLTKPSLFFLDEPTSGLDPATETRMMRLLRELADQGRTLVLITHATQNILLCDKVVFMARGGQIAFLGSPNEALDFFGVQEFVDIYDSLDKESAPGYYADRYQSSVYHRIHLGEVAGLDPRSLTEPARKRPKPADHGISRLRQFGVLTRRSFDILIANRKALAILLLQAPIVALLISLLYNRMVFSDRPLLVPVEQLLEARIPPPVSQLEWPKNCGLSGDEIARLPESLQSEERRQPCGNARNGMMLLFLISIVSIWLGTSNAAKEIVKELPIYRRERMVSLKIVPYLGSKLSVLVGVALLQTVMLLGIIGALIDVPTTGVGTPVGILVTTMVTFLAATILGLFVSAIVGTNDEAGNLVPILLIPQIIFAGAIFPFREMGDLARFIANFTFSKWSWEALGAIVDIPRIARAQGGQSLTLMDEGKWGRTFEITIQQNLAMLLLFSAVLLIASYVALKRKDSL